MAEGKLCVSVIEARNVFADTDAELSFYVRLRMGAAEVKTDVARNSVAPKFLKDVRMGVASADTDVLRIELLQCGPRGDLVVGSDELQVSSILNKGTIVHWFELTTFDEEVTAELCLVLRFLQAGSNRPMTPSYALAARDAKQRAIDTASGAPQQQEGPKLHPSKALFTDLEPKQDQAHTVTVSAAAALAPNTPARQAANPFQPQSAPHSRAPAAAGKATATQSGEVAAPGSGRKLPQWLTSGHIPLPLALLGGALAGAAIALIKSRAGSDASDLGAICTIGVCVGRGGRGGHQEEEDVSLQPGCRLRIPSRAQPKK